MGAPVPMPGNEVMAVCLSLLYMGILSPDTGSGLRAPGERTPPTKKTPMFSDTPQVTHSSSFLVGRSRPEKA